MNEPQSQSNELPSLWNDPVVEEVRAARRRLWEASGRDVCRYLEQSRQASERRRAAQEQATRKVG